MNLGQGQEQGRHFAAKKVGPTVADPGTGPGSRGMREDKVVSVSVALDRFISTAKRQEAGEGSREKEGMRVVGKREGVRRGEIEKAKVRREERQEEGKG